MRGQGWRYFHCEKCGKRWRETCRDYQTPSNSLCPTDDCSINLHGGLGPYDCESDKTIPVDAYGNLVRFELEYL